MPNYWRTMIDIQSIMHLLPQNCICIQFQNFLLEILLCTGAFFIAMIEVNFLHNKGSGCLYIYIFHVNRENLRERESELHFDREVLGVRLVGLKALDCDLFCTTLKFFLLSSMVDVGYMLNNVNTCVFSVILFIGK